MARRLMLIAAVGYAAAFGITLFEGLKTRPDALHWTQILLNAALAIICGLNSVLSRRPGQPTRSSLIWKARTPTDPQPSSVFWKSRSDRR